ncbi:MAG TPA: cellulase (glycosyl hydrolase family 5) [Prolixibacteraceae bacterium]|nr:cellulase (glycosyl hydrolase family 5) [Prolixibacteraceae bacterium]
MKAHKILALIFVIALPVLSSAQFVTVSGNKFLVDGKEIIMNGANTPWNKWNDFGGSYTSSWWDAEFQKIKAAGGNSTRIWISCNGEVGLLIASDGAVTGATAAFWSNLDDMFRLAQKNKIYIKATLISFDHFKNSHTNYQRWRNMIQNDDKVTSFVDNYVVPFTNRYKDNPYLWAIDVCNEIEWVNQDAAMGNIAWNRLQYFVARVASAVHDNSKVLVTLGSAAIKWNSDKFEGNFWSDAKLKAQYNKDNAKLDFYSPHFYGWVVKWFGNFALNKTPADYGINDRPCVIGENPAKGVFNDGASPTLEVPAAQMFLGAYNKGWKGLMPWTSNGVDSNGTLKDFESGLLAFKAAHPELIDPNFTTGMIPDIRQNKSRLFFRNIFPNPSESGGFNVFLFEYQDVILQLTDSKGFLIFRKNAENLETSFSVNSLPKGTYILSASKTGWLESRKLVLN